MREKSEELINYSKKFYEDVKNEYADGLTQEDIDFLHPKKKIH